MNKRAKTHPSTSAVLATIICITCSGNPPPTSIQQDAELSTSDAETPLYNEKLTLAVEEESIGKNSDSKICSVTPKNANGEQVTVYECAGNKVKKSSSRVNILERRTTTLEEIEEEERASKTPRGTEAPHTSKAGSDPEGKLPKEFIGRWTAISKACVPGSILTISDDEVVWKNGKDTDIEKVVYFEKSDDFPLYESSKATRYTLEIVAGPSYVDMNRFNLISLIRDQLVFTKDPGVTVLRHDYRSEKEYFEKKARKDKKESFVSSCFYKKEPR